MKQAKHAAGNHVKMLFKGENAKFQQIYSIFSMRGTVMLDELLV